MFLAIKNISYLLTAPPCPDTSLQVTIVMGGKSEITLLGVMGFQRLMFFNGLFKRSRARRLYSDQCNGS